MNPIALAREIAATHYTECRSNKKLFEHRVRGDVRLVGISPIIIELIVKIAIALYVYWITRNITEVSVVVSSEELEYLRANGIVDGDIDG